MAELQERIDSIEPEVQIETPRLKLNYQAEQIYDSLLNLITVGGSTNQEYLMSTRGLYDLSSGTKLNYIPEFQIPDYSALFQMHRKLYVCGGSQKLKYLDSMFECHYSGRCERLTSMKIKRGFLSLTGIESLQILMASAGFDKRTLSDVERFNYHRNKWKTIPSLNQARGQHGSCILPTGRAFCFCGYSSKGKDLNSIQKLDELKSCGWVILTPSNSVRKIDSLTAVPYLSNILVFGGNVETGYCMYIFSEDGKLRHDFSFLELIPGGMGQHAVVVDDGKIYTTGPFRDEHPPQLKSYDGLKWRLE